MLPLLGDSSPTQTADYMETDQQNQTVWSSLKASVNRLPWYWQVLGIVSLGLTVGMAAAKLIKG
jgi:hypothetical protein